MKKLLAGLGVLFSIVLIALITVPFLFKDEIKAALDRTIQQSVEAQVYYNADQVSVGLFKNFPNLTVGLGDFGIVGKQAFENDTLFATRSLDVEFDLFSLFNEKPVVNGIFLDQPLIQIKVLENGLANYDIAKTDTTSEVQPADTTSGNLQIAVDHWQIINGRIIYDDQLYSTYIDMKGVNHEGSGNFTLSVFDMVTQSSFNEFVLAYDGVKYMNEVAVEADVTLNMNLNDYIFTFRKNQLAINDFAFGVDGTFAMPESGGYDMDLSFDTEQNSFKNLLSLIPDAYLSGYENLETAGRLAFNGFVKGMYDDNTLPSFQVNLQVDDGMFHYPDLPESVEDVQINLLVDNPDGVIDNTLVNLKSFKARLGNNPVNMSLFLKDLVSYNIDMEANASLDLAELGKFIRLDGTQLKGLFTLDMSARGTYDSLTNTIPRMNVNMGLKDGFVRYDDYPIPLEAINFNAEVINTTSKLNDTEVRVNNFNLLLDEQPLSASMTLTNLADYTWDVAVNGGIDLEKIQHFYPLEGMDVKGILKANIKSSGKYSDVEAERYEALQTSGTVEARDFYYADLDLPQGFAVSSAKASFNPQQAQLTDFKGQLGKSDIQLDGNVQNYIGYLVKENEPVRGELNLTAALLDLNEFMTEADTSATEPADTASMKVIEVPKNIDFVFAANIAQVKYDNLDLRNVEGKITVRNGKVSMNPVNFNTLGGMFAVQGTYDTQNPEKPAFDFKLDIDELGIKKAYQSFNTVQALAPVAQNMTGNFSTDFSMKGLLAQDMTPVLASITGGGILKIVEAALTDSKLIAGINNVTNLGGNNNSASLQDVILSAEIRDGRVFVEPFELNIGNVKTVVAGSNGIDGSLDYSMKLNIPAGEIGSAVNQAIGTLTGNRISGNASTVVLNLGVNGTYNDPKVKLLGAETEGGSTGQAKAAIESRLKQEKTELKAKLEKQKSEAKAKAEAEAEKLRKEAEAKGKAEAEKLKQKAKEKTESLTKEAKEEAKKKLKKIFKPPY